MQQLIPAYLEARLLEASQKYIIRPYESKDRAAVVEIFLEGMHEYKHGTNKRPAFPSLDLAHQQLQTDRDPVWKQMFEEYTTYSMVDANMADLENYWSLPRRSIFLVAEEKATGAIVGTVALQPGIFNSDKYFTPYQNAIAADILNSRPPPQSPQSLPSETTTAEHQPPLTIPTLHKLNTDETSVTSRISHSFSYSKVISWSEFALGNLPSEMYCIDDPIHDPTTFQLPRSIVSLLPTPPTNHCNTFSHSQDQDITPPRPKSAATCQCSKSQSCLSKTSARFLSRLPPSKHATAIDELCTFNNNPMTERNPDLYFCQCVQNAQNMIDDAVINGTFPELCPYCIDDAQYLVQPFVPIIDGKLTPSSTSTTITTHPQYSLNPLILTYPNILSNTYPIELLPSSCKTESTILSKQITLSHTYPLQSPLPIYAPKAIPHGYYRRFLYSNFYPTLRCTLPLPTHLTNDTYLDFLLNPPSPQTSPAPYLLNTQITESLQTNTPFNRATSDQSYNISHQSKEIHLPFGDVCELRRMSVTRTHRAAGVAYLLMTLALQCASQVFKYKALHLSTSSYMTMAVKFYARFGFAEIISDWEFMGGDHCIPLAHYLYSFIPLSVESTIDPTSGYKIVYTNAKTYETSAKVLPWANAMLDRNTQSKPDFQLIGETVSDSAAQ